MTDQHPLAAHPGKGTSASPSVADVTATPRPRRLLVTLLALGALALLVPAMRLSGAASTPDMATLDAIPTRLPVALTPVLRQSGYLRDTYHSGRVEAIEQVNAAFERPGRIDRLDPQPGMRLDAGTIVGRLDDRELAAQQSQLEASMRDAEARLQLAVASEARIATTTRGNAASRQHLDDAIQQRRSARAALDAAQAALAQIRIERDKRLLRAPFDAVVLERRADPGAMVDAGTPVLRLARQPGYEARIGIAPALAARLTPGMPVALEVDGRACDATVAHLAPERDPVTRLIRAQFALACEHARLGDLAQLNHATPVDASGFWLPLSALRPAGQGRWEVLEAISQGPDDWNLSRRTVTVLYQNKDRAYVQGAIADGGQLVASGRHRVVAGQQVVAQVTP